MNATIPFDPDFDVQQMSSDVHVSKAYFLFGMLAGLGAAAAVGIIMLLSR